jgi:isopenicillin N synthase-like dioxygenase
MIPVIDLGPYLAPRPHASAATAAELGRALQDVGFFVIVNHGIPQTLIDDTFAEARRFHAPLTEDPAWLRGGGERWLTGAPCSPTHDASDAPCMSQSRSTPQTSATR